MGQGRDGSATTAATSRLQHGENLSWLGEAFWRLSGQKHERSIPGGSEKIPQLSCGREESVGGHPKTGLQCASLCFPVCFRSAGRGPRRNGTIAFSPQNSHRAVAERSRPYLEQPERQAQADGVPYLRWRFTSAGVSPATPGRHRF